MASMDVYDVRELPAGERLLIYGTGSAGTAFMHLLNSMRRDVECLGFVDSFRSGELEGKPVLHVDELPQASFDRIVVCSFMKDEILEDLERRGVGNCYGYVPLRTRVREQRLKQSCQIEQLYIRWDGAIFPCCYKSRCDDTMIGRIGDADLFDGICAYRLPGCSCEDFIFQPYEGVSPPEFKMITVETSLACQAECAMCCVHAPGWSGKYELDPAVEEFLVRAKPESVHFQGGEVLIQKQIMDWIPALKKRLPDTGMFLLTNGGVGPAMTQQAGDVFDKVWVTLSGFQPDTYRFVMGLDFERTMAFIDTLHARPDVEVWAKYLIVPSTLHETGRFFRWAAEKGFRGVGVDVALGMEDYIGFETGDKYWAKIMDRVSLDVRRILAEERDRFLANGQQIDFTVGARNFLNITDAFLEQEHLSPIIIPNCEDWKRWGRWNPSEPAPSVF